MAREMIRRMDDRLDLSDAFAAGMPSIMALNKAAQVAPGGTAAEDDPNAQGGEGGDNAPKDKQTNTAARAPQPAGPVG
jgi:hypothetical protein